MENVQTNQCWICGGSANSREHKIKKSDLKSVFGQTSQKSPLRYHNDEKRNIPIGGLDNNWLKSSSSICSHCNNTLTQPHDYAWETLSYTLRSRYLIYNDKKTIRANKIFTFNTRTQMLNVHLYFVKIFGCLIIDGKIPIDTTEFSKAILSNKAHPNLFLKFGYRNVKEYKNQVGRSNINTAQTSDENCAFATWLYEVESIFVNVMYAKDEERRQGLIDSWHPKFGTNKLHLIKYTPTASAQSDS